MSIHVPVLLAEILVIAKKLNPLRVYDMTCGGGGYTRAILGILVAKFPEHRNNFWMQSICCRQGLCRFKQSRGMEPLLWQ